MTMWQPELSPAKGPIYLAIADALASDIAAGRLQPRMRLPTHRELAYSLGVTVGTITRAYAEAERRGLVYGEVGRGTFVRVPAIAETALTVAESADLIDLTINFAVGEERDRAIQRTLAELSKRADLARFLYYHPHRGLTEQRATAAEWLTRHGLPVGPDNIIITAGGQHAMMTALGALCRPGDVVLSESLTYAGMKALAGHLQLRLHGVAMDAHGLVPEALAAACRSTHARVLYVQPTIQNPTSIIMPEARRREILAVARAHGLTVIEDDVYGFLPERAPPPLAALAPDITIYLTSASKCMAPGLRVGYIAAPEAMADRLGMPVRSTIWMAAPLMAEVARQWMSDGTMERIVGELRSEAMARHRMARRVLNLPMGGEDAALLLWLTLPPGWRAGDFVAEARRRGVAISAADAFAVEPLSPPECVRICLGAATSQDVLQKALGILKSLIDGPPGPSLSVV